MCRSSSRAATMMDTRGPVPGSTGATEDRRGVLAVTCSVTATSATAMAADTAGRRRPTAALMCGKGREGRGGGGSGRATGFRPSAFLLLSYVHNILWPPNGEHYGTLASQVHASGRRRRY